jgi:hypothetical protein
VRSLSRHDQNLMSTNETNNGWKMTTEEWKKIKAGDTVSVQLESGKSRPARFVTCTHFFTAKVIFEGDAEPTIVAAKNIGLCE